MPAPAPAPGTHPIDITVRRNLRLLRKARGWSLPVAGRRLGIPPGTLATYERSAPLTTIRSLRVEQVRDLAAAYGVPHADLYDPSAILMLTQGLRPSLAPDQSTVELAAS